MPEPAQVERAIKALERIAKSLETLARVVDSHGSSRHYFNVKEG